MQKSNSDEKEKNRILRHFDKFTRKSRASATLSEEKEKEEEKNSTAAEHEQEPKIFKLFLRYNIIGENVLPPETSLEEFLTKFTEATQQVLNSALNELGTSDCFVISSNAKNSRIIDTSDLKGLLRGDTKFIEGPSTRMLLIHEYLNYSPDLVEEESVNIYLVPEYIAHPETVAVTYPSGRQRRDIFKILLESNIDMNSEEAFRNIFNLEITGKSPSEAADYLSPAIAEEFMPIPMIIVGINDEAFSKLSLPHELMHVFWRLEHIEGRGSEKYLMYGGRLIPGVSERLTYEQHASIIEYFAKH